VYRELLGNVRFFELLLRVDEERVAKVQASGCLHCGGRLDGNHLAATERRLQVLRGTSGTTTPRSMRAGTDGRRN
jgi:hypothetical protein